MNKNFIIILVCIVLLAAAAIGYALWSNSNSPQDVVQTPGSDLNSVPVSQANSPIVKTDSATVPYISTVVVKGTVNPNGATTTYWYEYGETTALGAKTSNYLLGSGYVAIYTPAYITGLKSNTDYYFRLSASNSIGTVTGVTYSFKTNNTPAPVGIAPTTDTVAATDILRTTANLNGQINPNNSATTYWFEYGLTSNLGEVTSFQTSNYGPSASASISNLQPLTKYYFRLDAQNQFGTVTGQILNFTTEGPVAATAPTVNNSSVTAVAKSSAKLNASVNPNGAVTTYWFEYSINSLLSNILVLNTPNQSLDNGTSSVNVSANINNLTTDTKYYVRVVARNQYGTVRGDMMSFTTKK